MALKDLHRSPQLDALSIDNEIIRILEDKIDKLPTKYSLGNGTIVGALVRLAINMLCFLGASEQTVGMKMMNLRLTGFGRLTPVVYSLGRVVEYLVSEHLLLYKQTIHLLNTMSFIVFLKTGRYVYMLCVYSSRYPDFFLALFGIEIKQSCEEQIGGFSHEYIIRRLLWEQLAVQYCCTNYSLEIGLENRPSGIAV